MYPGRSPQDELVSCLIASPTPSLPAHHQFENKMTSLIAEQHATLRVGDCASAPARRQRQVSSRKTQGVSLTGLLELSSCGALLAHFTGKAGGRSPYAVKMGSETGAACSLGRMLTKRSTRP